MHKDWKKRLDNARKDKKAKAIMLGITFAFSSFLGLLTQEIGAFMLLMVAGLLASICFYGVQIFFDEQSMFDDEEEPKKEWIEKEESHDTLSPIHTFLEKNEHDGTKQDEAFIKELENLLQDISYIKNACTLSENEESNIYEQIPMHWYDMLQTYFAIFPINREELANELFLQVKEQREYLRTNYIQPHQDKLVQQCKRKAESFEQEKREYIYIQD